MTPHYRAYAVCALLTFASAPLRAQTTTNPAASQGTVVLSGYLKDAATGEPLPGATVFIKALGIGTGADAQGFYSLRVPRGPQVVTFTFVSYAPQEVPLTLTGNLTYSVKLANQGVQTDEVVVTGSRAANNVRSTEVGVNQLDMNTVKLAPALLGEADVVRAVLMLPGVTTVGEGSTGFNVRGGGVDQNLVTLDDAPLYNSAHLFGFFSVFNADAVRDLKLLKGGVPAGYGGRLSSVLDVRMKAANPEKLTVSGGLGVVSSRLAVEAPLIKDKLTLLVAGRRSYGDLFLKLIPEQKDNQAYFYDLNAKLSYQLSAQDHLTLTGYYGRDVFNLGQEINSNYGNGTGTARWSYTFNSRLVLNLTALTSQYDYALGQPTGSEGFRWTSNVRNYGLKADLTYSFSAENNLALGVSRTYYTFQPGQATPTNPTSVFNELVLNPQRGMEYAAYADHEISLSPQLSVRYGLRATMYDYLGAGTTAEYVGVDGQQKTPVNPRTYGEDELIKRYSNLEPRASLRYALNETSSLKAGYHRMVQYLHFISNSTASSPLDVWSSSTPNLKPEHADQVSVGYFRNFKDNAYEASVEVYGKKMDNQIDYINGANVLLNQDLEGELLYGRGRAYGAEFYLKKNNGPLTGWVSYTLSRSERQINGLNNNAWYVNKYDKTHYLTVVGIYEYNPRWSFSTNFSYSTGVATTFPDSRYEHQGLVVPNVNGDVRNNFRVPAYHRLDLSATLQQKRNEGRRWQVSWVFSLYNVYNRRNAYSIFFQQNPDNATQTQAVRLSVLGSVLPAVTYNFTF
ncbi:MAG: TonB-dependent receptor [Hymenobacter sp.]|nr:TonB-dependent receptor [Hymenobacter sp.]